MKIETQITVNSIINSVCLLLVAVFAILAFTWSMPEHKEQTGMILQLNILENSTFIIMA